MVLWKGGIEGVPKRVFKARFNFCTVPSNKFINANVHIHVHIHVHAAQNATILRYIPRCPGILPWRPD